MSDRLPRASWDPDLAGALDGVRVLDLSRLVAGNVVTHVLADHGAEVVKIERPGVGDDLRNWLVDGVSTFWKVYCRNKLSVTLDLRRPRGRDILLALAADARVLVENFRPGTMERWGLGPDDLHAVNPSLVIVRVSGWGQTGRWSHRPGFGSLVEAMSGFAAMNGFADRPPVLPPLALADMIAGLYGAFATMVATREIEMKGGRGQVIDLSLFEPILSVLGPMAANHALSGQVPPRTGSLSTTTAPRNVYACRDGKYVALSASMQAMHERLMRTIGREELIDDPRFRTNTDRLRNNHLLDPIVAEFMAARTQEECLEIFEAAAVTVGAVADIEQLVDHDYVVERGSLARLPDGQTGTLPMHAPVPRLSGTPAVLRHPAPELGEHNERILGGIGIGAVERAELASEGII